MITSDLIAGFEATALSYDYTASIHIEAYISFPRMIGLKTFLERWLHLGMQRLSINFFYKEREGVQIHL